MNVTLHYCPRCPTDEGMFASDDLSAVVEHLRHQHYVEEPTEPRCYKCGEPIGNDCDDLCGPCFLAKWSD